MKIYRLVAIAMMTSAVFAVAAQNTERKLLTMEDAVLNRSLVPRNYKIEWSRENPKEYIVAEDGRHYAVDIRSGRKRDIGMPAAVEPLSKPHAELRGNNIVWIAADGTERKVTDYADKNIVCGASVSRNEFGIDGGLFPSPDGSRLAFYVKDESRVTTFPLLDITSRTGTLVEIKYPMNGMDSERVSVGIYDSTTGNTVWLDVSD